MAHRCGLRPADGESEPNYWLGYSSGPRMDQHIPGLESLLEDEVAIGMEGNHNILVAQECLDWKATRVICV